MRSHSFCWLGVLTVLLVGRADGQAVSFDLYQNYLIVVRGAAGPLKGLNFLLDTGASPSFLDRRVAQKLHLPELPASVAVIAGSAQAGQSVVPSVEVGPVRRENLPVIVEDLSFFQKTVPVRIDAVIGLDLLGQSPFVIDYRSRAIRFGSFPDLATSLPLHMKAGLPIVEAELDHVSAHLLLDTGAGSLIVFALPEPRPMKVSFAIGDFDRKQAWLRSVRLGETEFGREPALLVQRRGDEGHDFDGLMSPAALGLTKVAVDLGRGVLSFSR
jgi:Aspartyl protease